MPSVCRTILYCVVCQLTKSKSYVPEEIVHPLPCGPNAAKHGVGLSLLSMTAGVTYTVRSEPVRVLSHASPLVVSCVRLI